MDLPSTPWFLCFHYFGPAAAHSHFSTSYTAHGLLFLSFRAPLNPFTSSRSIYLSHEPVIHYSYRLSLMGFLSIYQFFSVRVAKLLLSTWASKMAINRWQHDETVECNHIVVKLPKLTIYNLYLYFFCEYSLASYFFLKKRKRKRKKPHIPLYTSLITHALHVRWVSFLFFILSLLS